MTAPVPLMARLRYQTAKARQMLRVDPGTAQTCEYVDALLDVLLAELSKAVTTLEERP